MRIRACTLNRSNVYVCVRACVRACMRVCVCVPTHNSLCDTQFTHNGCIRCAFDGFVAHLHECSPGHSSKCDRAQVVRTPTDAP